MIALNDEQFELIRNRLDAAGLTYAPLSEELLDHICCQVEILMSGDIPFTQALKQAFDAFPEDEMQEVEQQTISIIQKKWTMKKVSLLVLGLMLAVTTAVWAFQQDPPSISPDQRRFQNFKWLRYAYTSHPQNEDHAQGNRYSLRPRYASTCHC
jgi:hypothetical protein